MPMLSIRTAVTQRPETDCKTLMRSRLADTLAHPMSRSWPNSSHQHQMKRTTEGDEEVIKDELTIQEPTTTSSLVDKNELNENRQESHPILGK